MTDYWTPVTIRITDVANEHYDRVFSALRDANRHYHVERDTLEPLTFFYWEVAEVEDE